MLLQKFEIRTAYAFQKIAYTAPVEGLILGYYVIRYFIDVALFLALSGLWWGQALVDIVHLLARQLSVQKTMQLSGSLTGQPPSWRMFFVACISLTFIVISVQFKDQTLVFHEILAHGMFLGCIFIGMGMACIIPAFNTPPHLLHRMHIMASFFLPVFIPFTALPGWDRVSDTACIFTYIFVTLFKCVPHIFKMKNKYGSSKIQPKSYFSRCAGGKSCIFF